VRRIAASEPVGEVGVFGEDVAGAVFGGEETKVAFFGEAAAVEEDFGILAGGADEATEGLVHFLDTGDLVDALSSGVAA
jgi:hypothetical protein